MQLLLFLGWGFWPFPLGLASVQVYEVPGGLESASAVPRPGYL